MSQLEQIQTGASEESPTRVLIVDDEEPSRKVLREYLDKIPGLEVIGESTNGFEAIRHCSELQPDLIFLDIQMPKLNGFEVVELLGESRPAIVFVTAYDQYALKAFEVNAIDYLLKPFDEDRLHEALRRVMPGSEVSDESAGLVDALSGRLSPTDPPGIRERVLVKEGSRIHVVAASDLDYAEAQDDYVLLVSGRQKLRKQETLSRLAASLDPRTFVRVHRSYVLNVERIERLELYAKDSRIAILRSGERLPVSRAGYSRLKELL